MTWLEETIKALSQLGGEASLKHIYETVRNNTEKEIPESLDAIIRRTLETNSKDSQVYDGKHDLFYCVHGIGMGVWGIRDFIITEENMSITQDDDSFSEGRTALKKHLCRERNQELIRRAKERYMRAHDGSLSCEICGFNFASTYGYLGDGFIEVHHVKPVSQMKDGERTNIDDLIMVCSNCHSMLHRKKPWPTKEQLKNILLEK